MTETKESPPSYTEEPVARAPGRKWFYGLLLYAGAVTAALITCGILGSLYLNSMKENCDKNPEIPPPQTENQDRKHYSLPGVNVDDQEDVELDLAANKEIIRFSGAQYGNGSLLVIDFKKGIAGVYNAKADECYLVGGLEANYPDASDMDQILEQSHDVAMPPMSEADKIGQTYDVLHDRPVKDLSMLPAELYGACWGKPVYWMKKHEEGDRQKRELWVCCLYWYCYRKGEWKVCYYCWYSTSSNCY